MPIVPVRRAVPAPWQGPHACGFPAGRPVPGARESGMPRTTTIRSPQWQRAGLLVALAVVVGVSASAAGPAAPGGRSGPPIPPPRSGRTVVDPAVVPAGGVARCPHCPRGGCRHVRHGGQGHHAGCRDGLCVPSCPVRPAEFGFYGTRWRRWPGQGVVPASAEAATPAVPPKSEVPGADEESPRRPDDEAAAEVAPEPPAPRELPEPDSSEAAPAPEPPAEAAGDPSADAS